MSKVTVNIPGKIMLAGEYSALQGRKTVAATVDSWMNVELQNNGTDRSVVLVDTDLWDEERKYRLNEVNAASSDVVSSVLAMLRDKDLLNFTLIKIRSEFDPTCGFGSSSALRLGMCVGAAALSGVEDMTGAVAIGIDSQRATQKWASGYDLVTQFTGGFVEFFPASESIDWEKNQNRSSCDSLNGAIDLYIGGKGAPTVSVMKDTLDWIKEADLWEQINASNDQLGQELCRFASGEGVPNLTATMTRLVDHHMSLFYSAPHTPRSLIDRLRAHGGSLKLTGSGGEDALLVFADPNGTMAEELQANRWSRSSARFVDRGCEWHLH